MVVLDYNATVDGKPFKGSDGKNTQLTLGKDLFLKGFDEQLIGVKKNDEKLLKLHCLTIFLKKSWQKK